MKQNVILNEEAMGRALTRMAYELLEKNRGVEDLVLIGIKTRGVPLAERLAEKMFQSEGIRVPLGKLDVTLYRDDFRKKKPEKRAEPTEIPFEITDKKVVLVDDVLFTGRSIRAAIEHLFDLGRPQKVQLAVLIDRGHRELPIRADYVGKNVPTSPTESVLVQVKEKDGVDRVIVGERLNR
jgi:pyrimidine operon attenuation protein/uracil phosphoribosyltransferase